MRDLRPVILAFLSAFLVVRPRGLFVVRGGFILIVPIRAILVRRRVII